MDHSQGFLRIVNEAKTRIQEISVEETRRKLETGPAFHFVDVREDHEWNQDHAQGAIHLGRGIIERDVEKAIPDKSAEIVLYCGGGFRSALAADNLQKMGYMRVLSMAGGYKEWRARGNPVASDQ
jgi:rhodanese-related sulfurtransferase